MFLVKPLTKVPKVRRRPGESLRALRESLVDDNLPAIVFVPFTFWFVWVTHRVLPGSLRNQSGFWLLLAMLATVGSAVAWIRLLNKARCLNRGELGEKVVGDAIDELRRFGYHPIHDIVRDKYNIDHVVVGPAGVFAIETKFRSGSGTICFRNGQGLFLGTRPTEKDVLAQARGYALEVSRIIQDRCGWFEFVKPVVVFVGDWHVKDDWQTTDARVFTPRGLQRYIESQQPRLVRREIEQIAAELERVTS